MSANHSDSSGDFVAVSLDDAAEPGAPPLAPAAEAAAPEKPAKDKKDKKKKSKDKKKSKEPKEGVAAAAEPASSAVATDAPAASPAAELDAKAAEPAAATAASASAVADASDDSDPSSPSAQAARDFYASRLAMLGIDEVGFTAPDSLNASPDELTVFDEYAKEAIKDLSDASQKLATLAKSTATDVYGKYIKSSDPVPNPLSTISTGLTSWWGGISAAAGTIAARGGSEQAPAAKPATPAAKARSPGALQEFFGLPDSENILESFSCTLLQQVSCSHNAFTKGLAMPFPGILCVTDVHCCFVGDDEATMPPFKLPHAGVKKVAKQRAPGKGEASLRLECQDGSYIVLQRFGEAHGLDDALALMELRLEELQQ